MSFAERYGLRDEEAQRAARELVQRIEKSGLETVRVSFADQHGLLRGKSLMAGDIAAALDNGVSIVSSLLAKDSANRTVFPVWSQGGGFAHRAFQGAGDLVMLPDPASFRVLPWAERTGWLLADLYFDDGTAVPYDSRAILRQALGRLGEAGFDFAAGLEVEFHVFRLERARLGAGDAGQPGPPPEVGLLTPGYQYLAELRLDRLEAALETLRRQILELGLPLRTVECEYGPSQVEFTFHVSNGLAPADTMVLFRSAAKQICSRLGLHATFMCRPQIANAMASGWHLHQSLRHRRSGANAFAADPGERTGGRPPLSPTGMQYLAGLLRHAGPATLFAAPTVNGYKRFRAHSLAPDRIAWGIDNRGALLRVVSGATAAASRIENRIGEPSANPYLYMASQVLAGLDGIERQLDPGPSADTPYEAKATLLPRSLGEACAALRADDFFRSRMGAAFVDYLLQIKEAEFARFMGEVTDWEQREYFEMY